MASNNQVSSDLKTGETINKNILSWPIDLRNDQQLSYWQPPSFEDKIQAHRDYNTTQATQHIFEMLDRGQAEYQREVYVTNIRSDISSGIENFAMKVENKKINSVSSYASLSHNELLAERDRQIQNLYESERKFRDLCQESDIASNVSRIKKIECYHQSYEIPDELTYSKDRCTIKELQQYEKALDLKSEIEATKLAIEECNWMIGRPEREWRDFVAQLEIASADVIEKKILPDLMAKNDQLTSSYIEKRNERIYKHNEIKAIETQLELLNKGSWLDKGKALFKKDVLKESLVNNWNLVKTEQQKLVREIEALNNEKIKSESQISYAQKILGKKKEIDFLKENQFGLQEAQILQENQETLILHQEAVKNQHDSCTIGYDNCTAADLQEKWNNRQEALQQTMQENFVQYHQHFAVSPETKMFLVQHGIDLKSIEKFFGTTLQQCFHSEMCEYLSDIANVSAQTVYEKGLVASVVDFSHAIQEANKKGDFTLVSHLLDSNSYMCKLAKMGEQTVIGYLTDTVSYHTAIVSGTVKACSHTLHMATHPVETIKGLARSLCYVAEIIALNSSDLALEYPEIYGKMRDERNAEIKQAFERFGNSIANARGPERVELITEFIVTGFTTDGALRSVGKICATAATQIKNIRTIESAAAMLGDTALADSVIGSVEAAAEFTAGDALAGSTSKSLSTIGSNVSKATAATTAGEALTSEASAAAATQYKILSEEKFIQTVQALGNKISKKNEALLHNAEQWIKQANAKLEAISESLLEQYQKMNPVAGHPDKSICIDVQHITSGRFELVLDKGKTYYSIEFKGGHLAGTMEKLEKAGYVEIIKKDILLGGCVEYRVKEIFSDINPVDQFHKLPTKTEFPASWSAEKIAEETFQLAEKAVVQGLLNDKKHVVDMMTKEGIELKIVTNVAPNPTEHICGSIENTTNRHIVTVRPEKG